MTIHIPSPLRSYTKEKREVEARGGTVADLLWELDRNYPGIRFRMITEQDQIRPHIRIFVNGEQIPDLAVPVRSDDDVHIICALSGG